MFNSPDINNVILFDARCNLCSTIIDSIRNNDTNEVFQFVSLQSALGNSMVTIISQNHEVPDSVIYLKNNFIYTESDAIMEIGNDLGRGWKVIKILNIIPDTLRDALYRFIAKHRYVFFGKKDSCLIPSY
ncbi:MAG: DCC1-like thiol-disulfide oxidoreductase family protein [Ignavibacteria bacterium]|nr:DCC1-like thiol-disulfide oxidoreductase family protein [Ignavibacteria bacterium]